MKTRTGFVSNSSSSSFIIGFLTKPRSWKVIKELLFGEMDYVEYFGEAFSTTEIAKRIFKDLSKKRPLGQKALLEEIRSGWFPGHPDYKYNDQPSDKLERQFREQFPHYRDISFYGQEDFDKIKETMAKELVLKIRAAHDKERKEYQAAWEKAANKYLTNTVEPKFRGLKIYALEYGDHDRPGATIEHGGVFENIPHIQISHH